ncbi:MAG TPA: hypothetical protein P5294_01435 [Smithellaceae bacterium]|nr:hypothetical protein [Smithellaceae bacterium]HRS89303.1 hypothetical protein [Smithellaceae bacterium]HRV25173.1 hypothetical protein [Smithellaceae bacterium]
MADFSVKTESGINTYRKAISAFVLLFALPILLSVINITFAESWKIHFFPAAVILAAVILGLPGGIVAGISGSLYTALFLGNPYVLVGNALFGAMAALFYKKTGKVILSVLLAYMIQLPWLILTDYYLAGLSADFIARLVVVLLLGNVLWAALIQANIVPLRKLFGHKP